MSSGPSAIPVMLTYEAIGTLALVLGNHIRIAGQRGWIALVASGLSIIAFGVGLVASQMVN